MKGFIVLFGVLAVSAILSGCGGDGGDNSGEATPTASAAPTLDPAAFGPDVENPLFPLVPGARYTYQGEETDEDTGEKIETKVESVVLEGTDTVGGVEVRVVEEKDYEGGELVEKTLDYYAQNEDGTVYYVGERVDEFEDGEVSGHSGQWLAGEGGAQAGVFMPANPQVGDEFAQELAPGVAEDQSKIVAVNETVKTAAGEFSGCIKTEDYDPIGDVTEFKFYCPGVGLVREEFEGGFLDLVEY